MPPITSIIKEISGSLTTDFASVVRIESGTPSRLDLLRTATLVN